MTLGPSGGNDWPPQSQATRENRHIGLPGTTVLRGRRGSTVKSHSGAGPVLQRLVHISRPVLWINTIGPAILGMWLAGHLWHWDAFALLLWLTLPFNLLIYGVNDIFDQETDALNPRKGSLEGARIRSGEVFSIWAGVLVTNIPFLAYFVWALPGDALLWIGLYLVVFIFYSAPPLRFKARPYLDSLSNAAYALPMVFVPLALGTGPVWAAALALMAWSAAKHTFDAVQDIEEDKAAGIPTTAVRLGVRGVVLWVGSGGRWLPSALHCSMSRLLLPTR